MGGPGKPIGERTTAEPVVMFFVLPPIAGGAALAFCVVDAVRRAGEFTATDWFWQVGWFGLLGPGLATGLPAAEWQELRRRREVGTGRT